jgi:hypothetical protein
MQPSPYDRTAAFLRIHFQRRPVASAALLLACVWIALNGFEMTTNWRTTGVGGWFQTVTTTVYLCAVGVLMLAALAWLIEHVLGDDPL